MSTPIADHSAAKGRNPTSHPFSSIRAKVDKLSTNLSRLGVAVSTTLNPNHRHDEEWEKEIDAKMEAIRNEHRYRSFAGERDGNLVKFHVDGHGESKRGARVVDSRARETKTRGREGQ
jgi:phospholipase D1/2